MQVHARIDGIVGRSVLPRGNRRNRVIRIEVTPCGVLRIVDAAASERTSGRELVAADLG